MTEQKTRPPKYALHDRFERRLATCLAIGNDDTPSPERTAGTVDDGAARAHSGVSDAEIALLASTALECAVLALGERHPEQFLHLRAAAGRAAVQEALASLPNVQASDMRVQSDYRKAIAFQDAACGLAQEMVRAVGHYAAAADERRSPHVM
jgi:hypothetical protein